MATLTNSDPPPIDYSSRAYAEIRSDAILMIPLFLTEWTDHNASDPGMSLIGLFSAAEDRLNYYIDRAVEQTNLSTALTRYAIVENSKTIGYQPSAPGAAVVDLTISTTLPLAAPGDVTIPAGTSLTSSTGEKFELNSNVVFPDDGVTTEITAVAATHGITRDEIIAVSDGRPNQHYMFTHKPVLDSPITVMVNAVAWDVQDALTLSEPSDVDYYLQRNEHDQVSAYFGNNVNGKIPGNTYQIRAIYRTGGGVVGQIEANGINENKTIALSSFNFTNPAASAGGGPHELDADIKTNAPRMWASQDRAVTTDDYEIHALQVSGVGKAYAYASGVNVMNVVVAPTGGGTAPVAMLTAVYNYLLDKKLGTDVLNVMSAIYVQVIISGPVTVLKNWENDTVEVACNANVEDLFAFANRDFGSDTTAQGDAKFSNLAGVIENTQGVDYVEIDEFRIDPLVIYEVWNGDVAVTDVEVSDDTVAETWTVQFTSITDYIVIGDVSGVQSTTGTISPTATYITDNGEVSFKVSSTGATDPLIGDKAYFRVSAFLTTTKIRAMAGEIISLFSLDLDYTGGLE